MFKIDIDQAARPWRIVHSASSLSRSNGGISKIAVELGIAQQKVGCDVQWLCRHDRDLKDDFKEYGGDSLDRVFSVRDTPILTSNADILHLHGIWSRVNRTAARLGKRHSKPYLLAPHGMLEPWAMHHHVIRKRIMATLCERQLIQRASCLHATAMAEVAGIRQFGYRGPIATIENGVNVSDYVLNTAQAPLVADLRKNQDRRKLVFLSRLHPKKGLEVFLESWASLRRFHEDWELVIAGPDEGGHRKKLEASVQSRGIGNAVTFVGPLFLEKKLILLRSSDIFVLPSYSEGFSMAILEALACELPVVITRRCNFPEVETFQAGMVVDTEVGALADATAHLMKMSSSQRESMGRAGRLLVETSYTWDRIADKMVGVYEWIRNGGEAPDCVRSA